VDNGRAAIVERPDIDTSINIIIDISTAHRRIFSFLPTPDKSVTRVPQSGAQLLSTTLNDRLSANRLLFELSFQRKTNILFLIEHFTEQVPLILQQSYSFLFSIPRIIEFIALLYAITTTIVNN